MSPRRKIFTLFSILAVLFLIALGINERARSHRKFVSTFSEMVISTDRALLDFSEVDVKYLKSEETKENYETAWFDLNYKLEQVKQQDDRLQRPPKELEELVSTYRAGLYRVLSVTNDVVDYLSGGTEGAVVIIKDREKFEEGLKLLREIKDRLQSDENVI